MEEVINKQLADDMKMIRKFDGSYATFKKTFPAPKVADISERMQHADFLAGAKISKAVFDSEAVRFKDERDRSPGPAKYEPTEPTYILQG